MTAQITHIRTAAETALAAAFASGKASLPGDASVRALRETAFGVFAERGLPHRRIESWHYSDLRAAMREAKPLAPLPDAAALERARAALATHAGHGLPKLVLVDGSFAPSLSDLDRLPAHVSVSAMADALAAGDVRVIERLGALDVAKGDDALLLNASFMRDGVVIRVEDGAQVGLPLNLIHLRSDMPAAAFSRSLVMVGAGAAVTVVEAFESVAGASAAADIQGNDALEFVLGAEAQVEHVVLQTLPGSALHLSTVTADLAANAAFNSFALVLGGGFTRRQSFVRYSGEHAFAGLRGASLLKGRQHADTTLVMDHAVPHGTSRELFKHVLDGAATGVYQGKVVVRQHAQKTDGGMKSNALLLSDDATMNNKPELEIFADDVVCGHGATCGALDDEMLFYIMARGLPRADAERLLIQAFVGEAVEFVSGEPVRDALNRHVETWLSSR